MHTESVVEQC